MKTSLAFSLAYLAGTIAGIGAGLCLPITMSGVVGWGVYLGWSIAAWQSRREFQRTLAIFRDCAPLDVRKRAIREHVAQQAASRAVCLGATFGCFAGAAAVDAHELLDALVWPGHEVDASILALLVALAWLVGVVASDADEETFRPGTAGFCLYLFTVALAVFPAVWEVL